MAVWKIIKKIVFVISLIVNIVFIFNACFPMGIVYKQQESDDYWSKEKIEQNFESDLFYRYNPTFSVVDDERKAMSIARGYLNTKDYLNSQPFKIFHDEDNKVWIITGSSIEKNFFKKISNIEDEQKYSYITIVIKEDGTARIFHFI